MEAAVKDFGSAEILAQGKRMSESPSTRLTLLARLRDLGDEEAWGEFVELYAPLLYGLARKHGLQDADAADLTQEVLRAVLRALPGFVFDPRRGSFRGWLFTIAYNELRKSARTRKRLARARGDQAALVALKEQLSEEEQSALWDKEYQQRLFEWAAEKVRPCFRDSTWQAFWQTAVEGQDPVKVGRTLGMSVGAIYIARSRVLKRIREQIESLELE
jgi:RNA polymerase sigma-70 factor (ECF subfamily)